MRLEKWESTEKATGVPAWEIGAPIINDAGDVDVAFARYHLLRPLRYHCTTFPWIAMTRPLRLNIFLSLPSFLSYFIFFLKSSHFNCPKKPSKEPPFEWVTILKLTLTAINQPISFKLEFNVSEVRPRYSSFLITSF